MGGNYRSVKRGDCVVVFSRKQVFETRRRIEAATGQKCAVVYGSLPPGTYEGTYDINDDVMVFVVSFQATRVEQAHLFNDPTSSCNVMVATDAIGMGLNL